MWETIEFVRGGWIPGNCSRLKVPGGWIVRTIVMTEAGTSVAQTFVEDPEHEWKLEQQPQPKMGSL